MTTETKAYGATSPTAPLAPLTISRRDPTERDVEIEILYCGVCHSDLHTARGERLKTVGSTKKPPLKIHSL